MGFIPPTPRRNYARPLTFPTQVGFILFDEVIIEAIVNTFPTQVGFILSNSILNPAIAATFPTQVGFIPGFARRT